MPTEKTFPAVTTLERVLRLLRKPKATVGHGTSDATSYTTSRIEPNIEQWIVESRNTMVLLQHAVDHALTVRDDTYKMGCVLGGYWDQVLKATRCGENVRVRFEGDTLPVGEDGTIPNDCLFAEEKLAKTWTGCGYPTAYLTHFPCVTRLEALKKINVKKIVFLSTEHVNIKTMDDVRLICWDCEIDIKQALILSKDAKLISDWREVSVSNSHFVKDLRLPA